ncbi:predicted protein [Streptomyces sp. SPB78]|nr:predicted protein [Streptomyces sp. SPB78]
MARRPHHVRAALSSFRAALEAVQADYGTPDPESAEDYARAVAALSEPEDRVCVAAVPTTPAPHRPARPSRLR